MGAHPAGVIITGSLAISLDVVVVKVVATIFGAVLLAIGVAALLGMPVEVCLNSLRLLFEENVLRFGVAGEISDAAW